MELKRITKGLMFAFVVLVSLNSCDVGYLQTFIGYDTKRLKFQNKARTTEVSCMYFQGCYYLNYGIMKGECTVNYDSLKLQTNDDNILIYKKMPENGAHTYKIRKDGCFSIRLGFKRKDKSISVVEPLVLSILPSDFITYNGQRITNDTLRVKLERGIKTF